MEKSKNPMKNYICLLKKENVKAIEYEPGTNRPSNGLDVFLGIIEAPDENTAGVLIAKKYGLAWDSVRVIDCARPETDVLPKLTLTNPYPHNGDCKHYEVVMRDIKTLGMLLKAIRKDRPCDKSGTIVLKYEPYGIDQESYYYNFETGQPDETLGIPNSALNAEILSVSAVGGWGNMTYCVRLKNDR